MFNLLLIAAVLAVFAFGYGLVNMLGRFLSGNCRGRGKSILKEDHSLHIGLSHPLTADSFSDTLKLFSDKYPKTVVFFYGGTYEELLHLMFCHQLDLVITQENGCAAVKRCCNCRHLHVRQIPVTSAVSFADGPKKECCIALCSGQKKSDIKHWISCLAYPASGTVEK